MYQNLILRLKVNKLSRYFAKSLLFLLIIVTLFLTTNSSVYATDYYVNATDGSDSNDGTSEEASWETITKVNNASFSSGDRILFKRGETWTGIGLVVPANNLSFGDYGSGSLPIIDGDRTVNTVFDTNTRNNLEIENIHIKSGTAFGLSINSSNNVVITGIEASDCGNDNIIFTQNSYDSSITNFVSHDNYDNAPGATMT